MSTYEEREKMLNKQENEYYESMIKDVEEDFEKIQSIISNILKAIINNEIFIVNNKDLLETNFIDKETAIYRFNELLYELNGEEDIINMQFTMESKEHSIDDPKGFSVYYPSHSREDISATNVEIITSVSQYIEKALYIKEKDNSKTFYRGHSDWKFKLVPGIYRDTNKNILNNESNYIKEIVASFPQYFKECKSALDFLSVLQHNGFPTRLLDFSENPLIALYMACDNDNNSHADTMRISVPKEYFKYYDSDTVSVISNIAFADDNFSVDSSKYFFKDKIINDDIIQFNKNLDIKKLIHLIRNEKPFFKPEINPRHLNSTIIFVKPKQNFDRISRQNGLFALFGIDGNKNKFPTIEYLNPSCDITHFIIPQQFKKKIVEELSRINITEANIYCDMEHVAKHYIKKSTNNEIEKVIEAKENKERKSFEAIFADIEN